MSELIEQAPPTWEPLDVTDAGWMGIESRRVLIGVDVPDVDSVRRAVRELLCSDTPVSLMLDEATGRARRLTLEEIESWPASMVRQGPDCIRSGDEGLRHNCEPLGLIPFRMVVGQDWLVVRMHHALADGWSVLALTSYLLARAHGRSVTTSDWVRVAGTGRNVLMAGQLARRPRAIIRAVRQRAALAGGGYEATTLADRDGYSTICRTGDPEFLKRTRALRDDLSPRSSLAAFVLTGLRSEIARRLPSPQRGVEVVYDLRRESPRTAMAFGNWSSGVYVVPSDDDDPAALTEDMKRVRQVGLPIVAAAATRRRARGRSPGVRNVASHVGRPRLSLSYIGVRHPAHQLPWLPGRARVCFVSSPPNGSDSISIAAHEVEGDLSVGVNHYAATWSTDSLHAVIDDWFDDPARALTGSRTHDPGRLR